MSDFTVYQPNIISAENPFGQSDRRFNRHVRVPANPTSWTSAVQERLNKLTSLSKNWDGYFGVPVSFMNAYFAARLIEQLYLDGVEPPQIVPGNDGSLQLEWHSRDFDVELDIVGPYRVHASRFNARTGATEEELCENSFNIISSWLNDFRNANLPEVAVA